MTRHDMAERDLIDAALDSWSRQRPDLKVQPAAVVMRINRLAAHFQAELDAVFAEFGLTNPSFELLATLRRARPPRRRGGSAARAVDRRAGRPGQAAAQAAAVVRRRPCQPDPGARDRATDQARQGHLLGPRTTGHDS